MAKNMRLHVDRTLPYSTQNRPLPYILFPWDIKEKLKTKSTTITDTKIVIIRQKSNEPLFKTICVF